MSNFPSLIKALGLSALLTVTATSVLPPTAYAKLSAKQLKSLNNKDKYKKCPKDSPCYVLETKLLAAKVADPSEAGGDENYILPMWIIIDGMTVSPFKDPNLRVDSDYKFRVNVSKKTIGNLGPAFKDRKTGTWVKAADGRARYSKFHNKDYVIPLSRDKWTDSEGVLFTVNMMEHDNSKTKDIDRVYYRQALAARDSVSPDSKRFAQSLKVPTKYGNATEATLKFAKEAIPMAVKIGAAAKSGGATAAAGATTNKDIERVVPMFKSLYKGLAALDKDDVGRNATIFIPFNALKNGKMRKDTLCAKTDPTASNTGKFCIRIGTTLKKVSNKTQPSSFDRQKSGSSSSKSGTSVSKGSGSTKEGVVKACKKGKSFGLWNWTYNDTKLTYGRTSPNSKNYFLKTQGSEVSKAAPSKSPFNLLIYSDGEGQFGRYLLNAKTGKALETVNKTGVAAYTGMSKCGSNDQRWNVIPVGTGIFVIQNKRTKGFLMYQWDGTFVAKGTSMKNAARFRFTPVR